MQTTSDVIDGIRELHRKRDMELRSEGDAIRRVKSYCRRAVGCSPDDDAKERARKKKLADEAFKVVIRGKKEWTEGLVTAVGNATEGVMAGKVAFEKSYKVTEKMLRAKAKETHVAWFVEETPGFGYVGLGQIIGEAGDLSNYSGPAKVWKRFGLAPHNGKSASRWRLKGGLGDEEWKALGYSPRRRSVSFMLGESLLKVSSGPYKKIYDARKRYEIDRFNASGKPVYSAAEAKSAKAKAGEYTPLMVAARRAQRYMEKRLLRDLWRAWRGQVGDPAEYTSAEAKKA